MSALLSISRTGTRRMRHILAVLGLTVALSMLVCAPAHAQYAPSVLYSFASGTTDGNSPRGLIFDSKRNLYGTTSAGGANAGGIAYELSPPASGSGPWTETILYNFCSTGGTQCSDGNGPNGPLVLDSGGNLYGTTGGGGNDTGGGVAFELSPNGSGGWTEKVLYSFCAAMIAPCPDGAGPSGGLIFDSKGNLYGNAGGGAYGQGAVFELSPPSGGSGAWAEKALYSFCPAGGICIDGSGPAASLVLDSKGSLYGVTLAGGPNQGACNIGGAIGCGTVFELSGGIETVIHAFAGLDGSHPMGNVIFDSQGNLYGTTKYGGADFSNSGDNEAFGVVFELSPPATSGGSWTVAVLHSFCNAGTASYCTDGNGPIAGMILDANGNLYGTTLGGGGLNVYGVAFEVSPPASGTGAWTESVLYGFNSPGTIGAYPTSDLVFDAKGNLYGAASSSGSLGGGTVIELVSDLIATTTSLATSPNPSSLGQSVSMTATVSAASGPTATGTVKFESNGASVGTASLNGSGVAVLNYSGLAKGTDRITAVYEGSATLAGSASNTVSQVVNLPSSTTTVTSSLNPSMLGQSVTLTATIAPAGPPAPTGTVGFTSLGTAITGCSAVTVSSSRIAACTTSTLPVGTDAILATYSGDSNYAGGNGTLSQLVNPIPAAVQFVPVAPCRVVDTRNPDGPFGGPAITGGTTRSFAIPSGPCAGIPSTATAYSLNVTVVPPSALGYLTIWPAGEGQPAVSTLNSLDGRVKANAALVPAGTSAEVTVYANNTTNVLLDINGYFETSSSSTLQFYPLAPCRVADTRKAAGPLGGPALVAATERDFPVQSSSCGIPTTAKAYSLNFTVVPPATGDVLDFLTVWPQGETKPLVSTLNNFTGTIVANAAIVPAGTTNGEVAVYPSDATNLLIDVNGYFAAPGTGGYSLYTLTPCRVLDTRKTTGALSGELTVNVAGSTCALSSTAKAYVFNATVVPSGDLGYLTLWPDGETQPVVSTLNAVDGDITSNMAIVPNNDGKSDAFASGTTQLVLDISAYFAP